MSDPQRNPQDVRFAPGDDPIPPEQQIPDWPSDSAEWMAMEPQGYPEPLFPDQPQPEPEDTNPTDADPGEEEATNG